MAGKVTDRGEVRIYRKGWGGLFRRTRRLYLIQESFLYRKGTRRRTERDGGRRGKKSESFQTPV